MARMILTHATENSVCKHRGGCHIVDDNHNQWPLCHVVNWHAACNQSFDHRNDCKPRRRLALPKAVDMSVSPPSPASQPAADASAMASPSFPLTPATEPSP